jgi:hypothetical protein
VKSGTTIKKQNKGIELRALVGWTVVVGGGGDEE